MGIGQNLEPWTHHVEKAQGLLSAMTHSQGNSQNLEQENHICESSTTIWRYMILSLIHRHDSPSVYIYIYMTLPLSLSL